MKISIQGRSVTTPFGTFTQGDVLTSEKYSEDFLRHLVDEAGCAAEIIETTKKPPKLKETSGLLSGQVPVSQKQIAKPRGRKPRQS
jgi:hypothetical protein